MTATQLSDSDRALLLPRYEVGDQIGRGVLVMDWIDGRDLANILKHDSGPVAEERALPWMRQVCQGMQAAAAQGIVHRDLKPSNILLDGARQALVADFGVARSPVGDHLSVTGDILGTPYYMAPEQAEDPRTVDSRADIYSFGATFYHVLTGEVPFKGPSRFSVLLKHKTEPLIPPSTRNPRLGERVSQCLERCLAKSPRDRFADFDAVLASLRPPTGGPSPWDQSDDPLVKWAFGEYCTRRDIYLKRSADRLDTPDVYRFPEGRTVVIEFGDLVEQQVDAVVSSDGRRLSMSGGVSAALRRFGGPALMAEVKRYAPVRPGRVAVTTAGNLPARFVFHAVTMGSQGRRLVLPSRDLISEIMACCFYHADTFALESIAFPLLGTGAGGFPRDICLDTMFRFLAHKFLHGATTVHTAHIVLFG